MPNEKENSYQDVENLIAEIAEKAGKQRSPGVLQIVLLAGLSSGIFSVGTRYVQPIDQRPDPFTGTQGEAQAKERRAADAYIQRQIDVLRTDQLEFKREHKQDHGNTYDDVEWLKRQVWGSIGAGKDKADR